MAIIELTTAADKKVKCRIKAAELIYGVTGVASPTNDVFLHPLTHEKLKTVNVDMGGGMPCLLIPAHVNAHYEIAKQFGLPIKQVVAPLFNGTGSQKIRPELPIQNRESVIAVVKHNTNDEYLCVDSFGRVCKSFVLGGIESGESPRDAALREIAEETGYDDIVIDHVYHIVLLNRFYADYKGVNRHATLHIVFCNLKTEHRRPLDENESREHAVRWIKRTDLKKFISVKNNQFVVDIINRGETAYTGGGIMINSNDLNGLTRKQARKKTRTGSLLIRGLLTRRRRA